MREGWREATLGKVLEVVDRRCGTNGPTQVLSITEKRGIVPQEAVFRKRIATSDLSRYKMLEPLDIAYNPYLLWAGAIGQWLGSEAGVTSPVYECFRVRSSAQPRFVGLLLESGILTPYFDSTAIGSIQRRRRTTTSVFLGAPILLPPLDEQRRIADLIAAVDEAIVTADQLAKVTRAARDIILDQLVADAANCKQVSVGSVARVRGGKRLPKGTPWAASPNDHPYIRVVDMTEGQIDEDHLVCVPTEVWARIARYTVTADDVLISIAGTIGEIAVVPATLDGANLTENAALIRVDRTKLAPRFLAWFLRSSVGRSQIEQLTIGTTQQKLALFRIESIEVPRLLLGEQETLVELTDSVDALRRRCQELKTSLATLRTGLLCDLLAGNHQIPASYNKVMG